jgi:hypothetical protein
MAQNYYKLLTYNNKYFFIICLEGTISNTMVAVVAVDSETMAAEPRAAC